MTKRFALMMTALLYVLSGCDAAEISTTEEAIDETETKYAVVESTDDNAVVISFSDHTTTAIPEDENDENRITVLKDSCTISMDDLLKDDSLMITYYKGEISAIQVIDDSGDSESQSEKSDDSLNPETSEKDEQSETNIQAQNQENAMDGEIQADQEK